MNKLEQAARQLLEVAEGIQHGTDWNNGTHAKIYRPKFPAAITAMREALEQPVSQEPVAWLHPSLKCAMHVDALKEQPQWVQDRWANSMPLYTVPQPVSQEPVAYTNKEQLGYLQDPRYQASPMAMWATPFDESINVALYTAQQPVSQEHSEHYWLHEINNALADGYERGFAAGKKQPVSQEPVAYLTELQTLEKLCNYINQNFKTQKEATKSFDVTEGFLSMVLNGKKPITKVMAHRLSLTRRTVFLEPTSHANGDTAPQPVKEVELTDDEIEAICAELPFDENFDITVARAVIAADRKLNGVEK